MYANIKGSLERIDKVYRLFTHNDKRLSKIEVRALLEYGLSKGYESTGDLSDEEIDTVLEQVRHENDRTGK